MRKLTRNDLSDFVYIYMVNDCLYICCLLLLLFAFKDLHGYDLYAAT